MKSKEQKKCAKTVDYGDLLKGQEREMIIYHFSFHALYEVDVGSKFFCLA